MHGASLMFSLFSRALSRSSFTARISSWSYTCCTTSQCQTEAWQRCGENTIVEKGELQNDRFVCPEEEVVEIIQQNGKVVRVCPDRDLPWTYKHIISRDRKDTGKERDFVYEKENNSLSKDFEKSFEYKMKECFENCRAISVVHGNKCGNYDAHTCTSSWPTTLSKLNLNCSYHGILANVQSRNLHTILKMYNGRSFNSSYLFASPELAHSKVGVRHKSFGTVFKKLFLKLFKDKDLKAKEEALKEIETKTSKKGTEAGHLQIPVKADRSDFTDQVVLPRKELLSDLIYGCTSSKHLLNLIVPWIENETVSLDDTVKAVEHLQNLVYSEIMELYPDLPYGSVSIMYDNLKLLQAEEKVFRGMHNHIAFQTMIKHFEQESKWLTNSQFATCISCLTHLGISHFHPLMGMLYTRLIHSCSEGYSITDIVNLYNVARCHSNTDFILAAYVVPKLSDCLKELKSHNIDIDAFRALLFVAENIQFGLKESELVLLYSHIYKVAMETNCLNNLNCACELLLHLTNKFYRQKQFIQVSSVYFQLLEKHRQNIIQTMSDLCIQKIEGRLNELSPLKIRNLLFLPKSCLQCGLRNQVEYLLKQRSQQLTLPELIWIMSGRRHYVELEPQDVAAISSKFEKMDLPNLYEAWGLGLHFVKTLDLGKLITKKTLEYKDEIVKHEKLYNRALTYSWAMWYYTKDKMFVNTELDLLLQKMLLEIYMSGGTAFKTHFSSSLLMTIPRFSSLQPTVLHMLTEVARKESTFRVLSQGNIFVILNTLCTSVFGTEWRKEGHLYVGNRGEYESVMFHILYKTVLEFHRTMQQDTFVMHAFIKTANLLLSSGKMDCVLQTLVYEKLTESPLQYVEDLIEICIHSKNVTILKIDKTHRKKFLNKVVTFALQNKDFLTFNDWRRITNFLLRGGFCAHDNHDLQKTLQTVVHQNFSLGSDFCNFVNQCCRLGVDMSKALKIIFSVEYLNRTDQLISDDILSKNFMQKALFKLNQVVCVSYPSLKVPWFQEEDDVAEAYRGYIYYWKYIPKDLHYAVTQIAGGDRFVGKEVFLDYGMPAWRVLLVDEYNNPVEYTTRNLKLANEMKCKIFVIWYIIGELVPGAVQVPFEMMTHAGYKAVVIYRAEWHSLGLPTIDDKIEFLRKKIFESSEDTEVHDPPMVNCKRVSDQWKQFLEAKG